MSTVTAPSGSGSLLSADQLEFRRTGIGGSDIAALAGVDGYRNALDVFLEKVGRAEPFAGNAYTRWGNKLESVIADEYAEVEGVALRKIEETLVHPTRRWMIGTPDRHVFEVPDASDPIRGLECKARGIRQVHAWGPAETDEVPESVAAQCQWYMALTGLERWDVAVLIAGNDFRIYRLAFDAETVEALTEIGERFWRDHVEALEPPAIDGTESWTRYLSRAFPAEKRPAMPAPPEAERWALQYREAKRVELDAATAKAEAANNLKALVGDAAGMVGEWGRISWKATKSGTPNWKAIAQEMNPPADLIAKHTPPGSRRFVPTLVGEEE